MPKGPAGAWDLGYATFGTVINDGGIWEMWYSGGVSASNEGMGYATSTDGLTWTKSGTNPFMTKNDGVAWRNNRTYTPSVIKDGNDYKMWFTGKDATNYAIGYATLVPLVLGVATSAGISDTQTIVYTLTTGTLDPTNGAIPSNWTPGGTNVADLGSITEVVLSSGNTVATITVSGTVGASGQNYTIQPLQAAFSAGFTIPAAVATVTVTAPPVGAIAAAVSVSGTQTIVYTLTTGTLDPTDGIITSNWILSGTNVADLGSITGVVLSSDNTVATITVSGTIGATGQNYIIGPLQVVFSAGFTTPITGATSTITETAVIAPVIVVPGGSSGSRYLLYPPIVPTPGLPNTGPIDSGCLSGNKFSAMTGNICTSSVSIPGLPTTGTVSSGTAYFRTLRVGTRGADVITLQTDLEQMGISPGPVDGIFGRLTRTAVSKYQNSVGLSSDGVFGPLTRGKLGLKVQ